MRYEYTHTLTTEYVALPPNAIVALDASSCNRPVYPNLVRMSPRWLSNGTTRTTHLSLEHAEEKQKQATNHLFKEASQPTPLARISNMDPSKENPTP